MTGKASSYYVQIPNKIFAYNTDYFMTDNELVVYYILGTMVSARNTQRVECSVDLLNYKHDFGVDSDASKNKKKIFGALKGLEKKGYILITASDSKIKNSSHLDIFIPKPSPKEVVEANGYKFNGYTEVHDELFEKTRGNIMHFKVALYVKWRSAIEFKIAKSQWSDILGVSETTAAKYVEECVDLGIVGKIKGKYYINESGNLRQETNGYKLIEQEEEDIFGESLIKDLNRQISAELSSQKVTDPRVEKSNLFNPDMKAFLSGYDWYLWRTTECQVTKKKGDSRFLALKAKNLDKYKEIEAQGKKIVEQEEKKELQRLRQREEYEIASQFRAEDHTGIEYKYKKKTISEDLEYFYEVLAHEDEQSKIAKQNEKTDFLIG